MATKKRNKTLDYLVWVLLGLLILGLMGFGIGNYSGISNTLGKVGSEEITVEEYVDALSNATNQISQQIGNSMSIQDAISLGASQLALASVTREAAVDDELYNIGLSVGDEIVFNTITNSPVFGGLDGNFDRSIYDLTLDSNGISQSEYDTIIRKEIARNLITSSLSSGASLPDYYLKKITDFQFQRRSYEWVEITDNFLTNPNPEGNKEDFLAFYEENPDQYTLPSTREITYAWVLPDMLANSMDITEEELRAQYEDLSFNYSKPETRAIDRLVFASMEEAQAAFEAIQNGTNDFDTIASEKGILLEDLDQGTVSFEDLPENVANLVFGSGDLDVVGPVQSEVGLALYRINAIIPPVSISFEEAREELSQGLAEEKATEIIRNNIESYNDILASGATIEELAAETELTIGNIQYNALSSEPITAYPEFREVVSTLTEDSFPEITVLDSGGVIAMRLDATNPPNLQPYEEVSGQVEEDWRANEILQEKIKFAESNQATIEGGVALGSIGLGQVNTISEATRFSPGAQVMGGLHSEIFNIPNANKSIVHNDGERVALALLTDILPPDQDSDDLSQQLTFYEEQVTQGVSADIFNNFTTELLTRKRFTLDQEIINSVHSQIQ